jgi:hypothetical protein
MELEPVLRYEEAQYPTLTEHLADTSRGKMVPPLVLAAALAALAALLGGCGAPS